MMSFSVILSGNCLKIIFGLKTTCTNELSKSVVNVGENQVDADAVGTSALVDLATCKQLRTRLSIMTGL